MDAAGAVAANVLREPSSTSTPSARRHVRAAGTTRPSLAPRPATRRFRGGAVRNCGHDTGGVDELVRRAARQPKCTLAGGGGGAADQPRAGRRRDLVGDAAGARRSGSAALAVDSKVALTFENAGTSRPIEIDADGRARLFRELTVWPNQPGAQRVLGRRESALPCARGRAQGRQRRPGTPGGVERCSCGVAHRRGDDRGCRAGSGRSGCLRGRGRTACGSRSPTV